MRAASTSRLRDNVGTRWKYGRAAAIVAVSRAVARVLERGGIAADRIRVVPDGVDVHRTVTPATRETLETLGVPRERAGRRAGRAARWP